MSKRIRVLFFCVGLMLMGPAYGFSRPPALSCQSQFSVVQTINNEDTRAEGLLFANLTDDSFLLNIDGLLTHNQKKYLISRTLHMKYQAYNAGAHLYKITSIHIVRDETDNVDDEVANSLLFSKGQGDKLIFIKSINNNVILFGNHAFPQYGCKRN